ncbi:cysteine dioxygenase [Sphingomonas sp.]|uniref:cysteine dioxygenase family protein n=1 Tax=Sphingomonas sp. TaxID=28214 RepID=UPI002DD6870B|nr:cysteine dioxygenase [Sphingomonas sp.]
MVEGSAGVARWRRFRNEMDALLDATPADARPMDGATAVLARLVSKDDWLPEAFSAPHPGRYQQYLLHRDARDRYSVVSFVWGPGQATPVHDHTVWGLVGMLRGCEASQRFAPDANGHLQPAGAPRVLQPGDIERLDPAEGDVHQVRNARDEVSISVHVYGADIGRVARHAFRPDGSVATFISGYSASTPPPDWEGNLT